MAIFFNFTLTSNHFHPLQVENCDSNSRLVVDEDDNGKLRLERVKSKFSRNYQHVMVVLERTRTFNNIFADQLANNANCFGRILKYDDRVGLHVAVVKFTDTTARKGVEVETADLPSKVSVMI